MLKRIRDWFKNLTSHTYGVILIYTFLWLILVGLILFIFNKNGKSFIWSPDGLYQHYTSFGYLCNYLKDLIYNFHFDGFFNFTLGQGMDILTTLNSYDFTDPISILCACLLPLSRAGRYTLMIFIKLYLIGISFLFYCHVIDQEKGAVTATGAITYTFCSAVLVILTRASNFVNWAYFFPFLLGGVELYFRKKKKLPLILFVFLNLITSYYTFYINAILVAIYVIVHVICKVAKEKKWTVLREELIKCLKLVGVCCIGILLSACILFPTIYAYINNNRVGELTGYTASALVYEEEYYKNTFENLFVPYTASGADGYIGINIVLIIPLILLFTKRKQYTEMKSLILVSLVMLGIPFAGRIMNGFGYATNRWVYALVFYVSLIFVFLFDEIKNMSEKEQAIVLMAVIGYITLCFLHTRTNENSLKFSTLIIMISVVAIVYIALHYKYPAVEPLILTLVFLCASFSVYFTYSEHEGNYVSQFYDNTYIDSAEYKNVSSTAAVDLSDNGDFSRIEMEEVRYNVNGINNVDGTIFWWSMVSGDIMDYYTNLAVDSIETSCAAGGLDGRTGLLELASVKYYTKPVEDDNTIESVPYGYREISSSDERYQIFENTYALPVGYTYTDYISSFEYGKMNGIEKEQALLQGAVLDQDLDGFAETDAQFDYTVLDYDIGEMEGVTWENNYIKPTDMSENTTREINLDVDVPNDCEIYVYISGVEVGDETDRFTLKVIRTNGACSISKSSQLSNLSYTWTPMQEDVAFNLGTGYEGRNTITLSFNKAASLSINDLQVIAVPMATYEKYAQSLGEYVLENVSVEEDHISGTISVPDARILQFSVPYSDGWKAYVDDEEVSIMKSDVMYMAIPLSAGDHTIELRYETPYLRLGIIVTIATAVLYAAYEIIRNRKSKGVQKMGKKIITT